VIHNKGAARPPKGQHSTSASQSGRERGDALSNALVAALTTWPRDVVPQNPEAWLLTAARHSLIDLVRQRQLAAASEPTLLLLREEPSNFGPEKRPGSFAFYVPSKVWEILFPILAGTAVWAWFRFDGAQLNAPDLARDGFGQFEKFDAADTLVGG
jgi:hypothetical protein